MALLTLLPAGADDHAPFVVLWCCSQAWALEPWQRWFTELAQDGSSGAGGVGGPRQKVSDSCPQKECDPGSRKGVVQGPESVRGAKVPGVGAYAQSSAEPDPGDTTIYVLIAEAAVSCALPIYQQLRWKLRQGILTTYFSQQMPLHLLQAPG